MYDKLTYKFDYQIEKSPVYPMDYMFKTKNRNPILLIIYNHILLYSCTRNHTYIYYRLKYYAITF